MRCMNGTRIDVFVCWGHTCYGTLLRCCSCQNVGCEVSPVAEFGVGHFGYAGGIGRGAQFLALSPANSGGGQDYASLFFEYEGNFM